MPENFIILSPHLDDAVWSLGGYLKQAVKKGHIEVINIFSKCTFIFGKADDKEKATRVRKLEDKKTLNTIGIKNVQYLDLPEALLRGYSPEQMFLESDVELDDTVMKQLGQILRKTICPGDTLLIPSGFGGHVDHYLTRNLATHLPGTHYYYEDLPYAARSVRRSIAESFLINKKRLSLPISQEIVQNHVELIQMYKSQIKPRHIEQIGSYIKENGYTLWV